MLVLILPFPPWFRCEWFQNPEHIEHTSSPHLFPYVESQEPSVLVGHISSLVQCVISEGFETTLCALINCKLLKLTWFFVVGLLVDVSFWACCRISLGWFVGIGMSVLCIHPCSVSKSLLFYVLRIHFPWYPSNHPWYEESRGFIHFMW